MLNKIFAWLLSWGVDRYAHFALASVIASVMLIVFCWLPYWASLLISAVVSSSAILVKDYVLDSKADLVDIAWGYAGATMVWVVWIVANIV